MKTRTKVAGGLTAATLAAAAAFITPWEGVRTLAYRDPVGIWTVCIGETEGVKPGDRYTAAQCTDMLKKKLPRYWNEIAACMGPELVDRQTEQRKVAFISFAYNVGSGAFCRSTLLRKLRAGDVRGACNELPRWDKAGGQSLRGLTRRRKAERELCLEGL
ncbi:lysozyme [Nitrobacter sp.]|uniref:lysozyme n=1 Tax=Nitrobacter sp. TaxID=29420 RepID=UPI001DE01659|nr:lysozyme [Nitrobacter sp.]MCB1393235.1 lysozyme [Nitrobacter sp.]